MLGKKSGTCTCIYIVHLSLEIFNIFEHVDGLDDD